MNKDVGSMYVAIVENRVVFWETNLTKFWELIKREEPKFKGYNAFYKDYQKTDVVKFVSASDKIYIFQKVL